MVDLDVTGSIGKPIGANTVYHTQVDPLAARHVALQEAVKWSGPETSADEVVSAAKKFMTFLIGE